MKNNYTHMVFVMDRSGSMGHIINETIDGFNEIIKSQKEIKGEASVTLAIFDHNYELIHDFVKLENVPQLTESTFYARGWTALLDAVGKTINEVGKKLSSMEEDDRPEKVIVTIFTDGEENYSKEYSRAKIKEMITHQEQKYGWTFTFIGANIDSFEVSSSLGISYKNTANYTATERGTKSMMRGVNAFYSMSRTTNQDLVSADYCMEDYVKEEK